MSNHSNSTPFTSWGRERATSGARAGPGGGQHAPPRPADPRPNNLYVKGLPEHWTDDHLRTLFEPCGAVLSCRVLVDKGGVSKKCGYVQLSTATAAAAATSALNGVALTPSAPPLAVLPAASRVERRAEAAAARAARLATVLAPRPVAGGGALVLGPGGRAYQPPPVGEETAAAAVAVATGPAFVAAALGRGKQGGREE